jgi:quercetin dioxygenase-like cupin family protein
VKAQTTRHLSAITISFLLLGGVPAQAQKMEVSPNGSRPTAAAPAEYFTGSVLLEPLFGAKDSMPATGGLVTFTPGARSAWHTHPAGQFLIVTSGTGWVQEEGGVKREIKPGDVIWTPPGVKHWHGATATNSMSHIAITNMVNGKNVEWLEKVSEEQYQK